MKILSIKQIEGAIKDNPCLLDRECPFCDEYNIEYKYWVAKTRSYVRIYCTVCAYKDEEVLRELNEQETFVLKCLL